MALVSVSRTRARRSSLPRIALTVLLLLFTIALFCCDLEVLPAQGTVRAADEETVWDIEEDNEDVWGEESETLVDMISSIRHPRHADDQDADSPSSPSSFFSSASQSLVPSLERGIEPPLPSWPALQKELVKAKCATRVHHFLSAGSRDVFSEIPSVCRRPIAVIITNPETEQCPSCLLFSQELFSSEKPHLQTLQALRDGQVSVVLHVARPGANDGDKGEEEEEEEDGVGSRQHFFSETIRRHPVHTATEEDVARRFPLEAVPATCDGVEERGGGSAGGEVSCEEHRKLRWTAGLRAVRQYWKHARERWNFREAWKQSYAGEGEYALRVLFLWPHNGSVMPIVNPEWALYAGRLNNRDKEPSDYPKGNQRADEEDERNSHLYISAKDFLRNCVVAWEMVNELFHI